VIDRANRSQLQHRGAYDPRKFGFQWWRRREWAKTNFYQWMPLIDRWR
jgi:hypothetical protein